MTYSPSRKKRLQSS